MSTANRPTPSRRPPPPSQRPGRQRRRRRRKVKLTTLSIVCLFIFGTIITTVAIMNHKSNDPLIATSVPTMSGITNTSVLPVAVSNDSVVPYTNFLNLSSDAAKPLAGKVIILDPGHGGKDPGCVYPGKNPVYKECDITLSIAQSTKAQLESQGATVVILRTDDSWVSLYGRVALTHLYALQYANQLGIDSIDKVNQDKLITALSQSVSINDDDLKSGGMSIMAGTGVGAELEMLMNLEKDLSNMLFLSIHVNTNSSSNYHGTQIYYITNESMETNERTTLDKNPKYRNDPAFPIRDVFSGRNDQRTLALAESLYQAITTNTPRLVTNMPVPLQPDNFAVLREHNVTSALVEVAFLTNEEDRAYITGSDGINAIATGIEKGCEAFFANGQ